MISMTGYAQGRYSFEHFTLFLSIKSLNHRYLDLGFKGNGLTPDIEKMFKEEMKGRVHRGKIELTFNLFEYDPQNWDVQLNEGLLDTIIEKFSAVQSRHPGLQLSLDSFLRIPMIFHLENMNDRLPETAMERIRDSIRDVLDRFLSSRREEGRLIEVDIQQSLALVNEYLETVTAESRLVETALLDRYRERIALLLADSEIDERRIAQEAAIAADRSCIAEEISRLTSHRDRMVALCTEESEFIGREADFLAQEMLRETHTIAAKTSSLDIHRTVLQIRRQVEKVKQQVQNVE